MRSISSTQTSQLRFVAAGNLKKLIQTAGIVWRFREDIPIILPAQSLRAASGLRSQRSCGESNRKISTEDTDLKPSMTTLRNLMRRLSLLLVTAAITLAGAVQAQAQVKAYPVAPTNAEAVVRQLNQKFPDTSGVRITYDPRTSQVLVVGPPAVQNQVAELLPPPPAGELPVQSVAPAQIQGGNEPPNPGAARGPKVVPLHHMTGREFESSLSGALGRVLPVNEEHGGEWARYTLDTRGGSVTIVVDRKANQVALEGPVRLADAWARVIESIDNRPPRAQDDTRVIPLTTARTADVLKAMSALREHGAAMVGTVEPNGGRPSGAKGNDTANGRLISMIFQPRDGVRTADRWPRLRAIKMPRLRKIKRPTAAELTR